MGRDGLVLLGQSAPPLPYSVFLHFSTLGILGRCSIASCTGRCRTATYWSGGRFRSYTGRPSGSSLCGGSVSRAAFFMTLPAYLTCWRCSVSFAGSCGPFGTASGGRDKGPTSNGGSLPEGASNGAYSFFAFSPAYSTFAGFFGTAFSRSSGSFGRYCFGSRSGFRPT